MSESPLEQHLANLAVENIETIQHSFDLLLPGLCEAIEQIAACLLNDGKLIICGNGPCHLEAQRLAGLLQGQAEHDRPSLPALALSSHGPLNNSSQSTALSYEVFGRQITAIGQSGDLLVLISTFGRNPNMIEAVTAARDHGMGIIALTGRDGGHLSAVLGHQDLELRVPSERPARIQEAFHLMINCMVDSLDQLIFGFEDEAP